MIDRMTRLDHTEAAPYTSMHFLPYDRFVNCRDTDDLYPEWDE